MLFRSLFQLKEDLFRLNEDLFELAQALRRSSGARSSSKRAQVEPFAVQCPRAPSRSRLAKVLVLDSAIVFIVDQRRCRRSQIVVLVNEL